MKSNAKNGQNVLSIIATVLRYRSYNVWLSCLRLVLCCLCLMGELLFIGSSAQAQLKAGDLLVIVPIAGTIACTIGPVPIGCGALFVVNPETGQRTVLSDFGNPAQGSLGKLPTSVVVGRAGQIFVSTRSSADPAFVGGALFEVDPETGHRTLLSNFAQGEIQGGFHYGLAVDAKGRVIANLFQRLVRIDPRNRRACSYH